MKKKKLSIYRTDAPPLNIKRMGRIEEIYDIRHHGEHLRAVYKQVPEGTCAGCTACCIESVNTFLCEFVAIRTYMEKEGLWTEAVLSDILRFYIMEMAKPMACPMLRDGKCMIYPVRPLQCRIFGSYTKEDYEEDYQDVLKENEAISAAFKEHYGFYLSEELVNRKLPFCTQYQVAHRLSREQKRALMDGLFALDAEYMGQRVMREEEWGLSLMAWFGRMAFGREEAIELRVRAAKDHLEGSDMSWLEAVISKAAIAMAASKI